MRGAAAAAAAAAAGTHAAKRTDEPRGTTCPPGQYTPLGAPRTSWQLVASA